MSFRSMNEDRLSHLPDEVLGHILSLMPFKFTVQTSTLSKGWRNIWKSVTILDFDRIPSANAVDRVLKLCKTSQLTVFWLRNPCFPFEKSELLKWINEAVRLNVCEVDINAFRPTELPLSLLTCKTLTTLRLHMLDEWGNGNFPSTIVLPSLKTLEIRVVRNSSAILMKFIQGCPVLESLSLEIVWFRSDEKDCNVNIPTLKRLELRTKYSQLSNKYFLNVPNLQHLFVSGHSCPHFVMEDLPSLVHATVSVNKMMDHDVELLLKGLRGVKSLSWFTSFINGDINTLPRFPNLKHLDLKGSFSSRWILVNQFFESCSELEHLCIEEPEEAYWIEPQSVPTCILSNLKTMKITKCKGREYDIRFLEYILKNAEVLKRLTIICGSMCMNKEKKMCARLLKFPKASRLCEIHFVGEGHLNSAAN